MTKPNYQKPPLREEIEAFFKQLKGVIIVIISIVAFIHLDELKSQGIYVVDVSLVSTVLQESSYYGDKIYNEYMIRLVKPKYEVIGETDDPLNIFESGETKSLGYFKSNDEVEKLNNNISLKTTTM